AAGLACRARAGARLTLDVALALLGWRRRRRTHPPYLDDRLLVLGAVVVDLPAVMDHVTARGRRHGALRIELLAGAHPPRARRHCEDHDEDSGGERARASAGHAISSRDQSLLRSRGPSGFITRTPGAPTKRCAVAACTTASPRRATLRSSPTAVIHVTGTPL